MLCICCIYFLFTTCVLWQHYLCWTYTVPTIHVNDAMHTIPIISIIHIIHTIHMKCNYHTYHTYNSIHTIAYIQYQPLMPYIPYLPYIPNIPYFPNMPYQTDHTHHTYPPYHTTPPPHHRGGGGQCHTPTTPQGGRGKISYGTSIWDPSHMGGEGGWQGLVHIYTWFPGVYPFYMFHRVYPLLSMLQRYGCLYVSIPRRWSKTIWNH